MKTRDCQPSIGFRSNNQRLCRRATLSVSGSCIFKRLLLPELLALLIGITARKLKLPKFSLFWKNAFSKGILKTAEIFDQKNTFLIVL